MHSPFPGMDPYLESPEYWRGAHQLLIAAMLAGLSRQLPPGFFAKIEERLYIVQPQRSIYPDIAVYQRPAPAIRFGGGVGVADYIEVPAGRDGLPLLITVLDDDEPVRESFIEITFGRERTVVTTIELLSPANKAPGSEGREPYVTKQLRLLRSGIGLVEIDLLRGGAHTVAVPRNSLPPEHSFDYLVSLHRGDRPWNEYEVWPISIRDRLPVIRIPLTPDIPDVPLDLQTAFERCYEDGAFRRDIDYLADADPPLRAGDAGWADARLREAGLRS